VELLLHSRVEPARWAYDRLAALIEQKLNGSVK
jgi:hypothetical protein